MVYPELDNLFRELLASNGGPGYGVSVLSAAADLSVIDVDLRFIAGRTYCCSEPGCHLGLDTRRLVRLAAKPSIALPESVLVRWHCHVEAGARFDVLKKLGLPAESGAYDYEAVLRGAVTE